MCGGLGGLLNAYLAQSGFVKWSVDTSQDGKKILNPGWLGNVFVGAVGAFVMWALYSVPSMPDGQDALTLKGFLPQLAGAILVGVGGSRILTNEVDKRYLDAANKTLAELLKKP